MAKKEYNVITRRRAAKGRRGGGVSEMGSATTGGAVTGGGAVSVSPTPTGGDGHSHSNKELLDRLQGEEGGGYLYERVYNESGGEDGEGAYESRKVKAGWADAAGQAANSEKWNGKGMAEMLDQPVRRGDAVEFGGIESSGEVKGERLESTGDTKVGGDITIKGNASIGGVAAASKVEATTSMESLMVSTPDFVNNGVLGSGGGFYQLNGLTYAEFDYLTARRGMTVFELLIQEYRSIGGVLIVSPANGEVENVARWTNEESGVSGYHLTIKDFANNPQFVVGDLVRCAKWDADSNAYIGYWVEVKTVYQDSGVISIWETDFKGVVPHVGDKLVQMGNTTDATRQGCVEMSTVNSLPRITVYAGIASPVIDAKKNIKCLHGALTGFVDPYTNEVLSGYGMWGDNAYLHGEFILTTGKSVTDTINAVGTGRNLLLATNQGTTNWRLGASLSPITDYYTIGAAIYQGVKGVSMVRKLFADTPLWEVMLFTLRSEMIVKGKTYHLSFDMAVTSNPANFNVALATGGGTEHLYAPLLSISHMGDGEYTHYDLEITAHASGDDDIVRYVYISTKADSLGNWDSISIVNLKLEEGLKATEWTAAPEDAETKIAQLQSQQTEFRVSLDEISATVRENYSDLNGRVTTNESQIKQTADSISLKVKEAVNELNWECTNLLLDSSREISNTDYLLGAYSLGSVKPMEGELVTLSFSGYLGDGHGRFTLYNSGWAKMITALYASDYNATTQRYEKTFNWVVGNSSNEFINIFQADSSGNRIDAGVYENADRVASKIYDIKLERSSKATPYAPSTEQALVETGINIKSKAITVTADNFFVKNNANEVTAAVDGYGNFKANALGALNADGSPAITANLNNDKSLKFYYEGTTQIQLDMGWNGTSLMRYYDQNGVMLWQIGDQQGFLDADYIEWTAVGLYDTGFSFGIDDFDSNNMRFANVGNVSLGTYYQHNVINARPIMYQTKSTSNPINGWYTNQLEWVNADTVYNGYLKRIFIHYTDGVEDWRHTLLWDTINNEITIA